jgi:hypothetical protein
MKRLLILVLASMTFAMPVAIAQAGQRIGSAAGLSATRPGDTTRQDPGSPSSNTIGTPVQRLGNFEYYDSGMVLPRHGNSCLTASGTTFCQ